MINCYVLCINKKSICIDSESTSPSKSSAMNDARVSIEKRSVGWHRETGAYYFKVSIALTLSVKCLTRLVFFLDSNMCLDVSASTPKIFISIVFKWRILEDVPLYMLCTSCDWYFFVQIVTCIFSLYKLYFVWKLWIQIMISRKWAKIKKNYVFVFLIKVYHRFVRLYWNGSPCFR